MTFIAIPYVPHINSQNQYFADGFYVKEIKFWFKYAAKIIVAVYLQTIVKTRIQFSTYFEGYGLVEDADFSVSALQFGKM